MCIDPITVLLHIAVFIVGFMCLFLNESALKKSCGTVDSGIDSRRKGPAETFFFF